MVIDVLLMLNIANIPIVSDILDIVQKKERKS